MINQIIDTILSKFKLFHTEGPTEAPRSNVQVTLNSDKKAEVHPVEVVATHPRTVNFTVTGTVNGQRADRITGGEHDTTESIQALMVRLFREQRGITNAVVTDPADNTKYDVHRRGENRIAIFAQDNSYSEEITI